MWGNKLKVRTTYHSTIALVLASSEMSLQWQVKVEPKLHTVWMVLCHQVILCWQTMLQPTRVSKESVLRNKPVVIYAR